jgi:hypothetical protein
MIAPRTGYLPAFGSKVAVLDQICLREFLQHAGSPAAELLVNLCHWGNNGQMSIFASDWLSANAPKRK